MSEPTESAKLFQRFTTPWLLGLIGVPLSYAVFRYHIFGGVEWSHLPLFIANKAASLSAVFFIAMSYLIGKVVRVYDSDPARRLIVIKLCGIMGFSLAGIHAFMSLLLFSPEYYPKFFGVAGKLNLTGELSMAFGVISMWCLSITAITSLPFMYDAVGAERWKRGQRMGYYSLALVLGHLVVMGIDGWLKPGTWHGYLPPISLVASIAAAIPLLVKMLYNAGASGR